MKNGLHFASTQCVFMLVCFPSPLPARQQSICFSVFSFCWHEQSSIEDFFFFVLIALLSAQFLYEFLEIRFFFRFLFRFSEPHCSRLAVLSDAFTLSD